MKKLKHSQNFIKSTKLIDSLIKMAGISDSDTVLEIGAGSGNITERLCRNAGKVVAIEKDKKLYDLVDRRLRRFNSLDLIRRDFFDCALPDQSYKCFSNIPFNYTADIVRRLFLSSENSPVEAYLFMQSESAERFMVKNSVTQISLLLAPFWDIRILHNFKRFDFKPVPSVDAVFVQFKRKFKPDISQKEYLLYRDFICFAFNQWKSNVGQSLRKVFSYKQLKRLSRDLGFNLRSKSSEISYKQWLGIFKFVLERKNEVYDGVFKGYYSKYEKLHVKRLKRGRY